MKAAETQKGNSSAQLVHTLTLNNAKQTMEKIESKCNYLLNSLIKTTTKITWITKSECGWLVGWLACWLAD